jgi:chemotaxis protein MotA
MKRGIDKGSYIAVVLGIGGLIGSNALEGGNLSSILQPTAALIVFGGTFAAAMLQFPTDAIRRAFAGLRDAFAPPRVDIEGTTARLIEFARLARKEGLIALEREASYLPDPFFRKALNLAVDGADSKRIREIAEIELTNAHEEGLVPAKFWDACGGYAPTIGILGAVLGLIHVMQNLSDPSSLGSGIAVAFVATIYGVGSANLIFLPIAGKLKIRHATEMRHKSLILEGVAGIAQGDNPRMLEQKLDGFAQAASAKPSTVTRLRRAA